MADEVLERVKVNNLEAHLKGVLSNVAVANKELSAIFQKIPAAEIKLAGLERELAEASRTLALATERHEQVKAETENRLVEVARAEALLTNHKAEHEARLSTQEFLLSEKIEDVAEAVKALADIEHNITTRNADLARLSVVFAYEQKKIKELTETRDKLVREAEIIRAEQKASEEFHAVAIRNHNNHLEEIKQEIYEEKRKVGQASIALKERETVITGKEKNLDIIQQRINNIFKELFPTLSAPRL